MSDTEQPAPEPARPRRKGASLGLLAAMAAMMGATLPGMGGTPRVDKDAPDYVKTPEDLARMAKAQEKRERKKARNRS